MFLKNAYDPSTGPTTVPTALKDCAKLIRSSEYLGGPQTAMNGFAAVSSDPSPEPMMKVAPQKPPNDRFSPAGHISRPPMP